VAERAQEMIQKSLCLALFVAAHCLHEAEANKLSKSALQLVSHGCMVTKSVTADKSAPSVGTSD